MKTELNPAGIVRQVDSLDERVKAFCTRYQGYRYRDNEQRRSLTDEAIAIRDECKAARRNWLPVLQEMGLPQSTFSDWLIEFYPDNSSSESATSQVACVTGAGSEVDKTGSKLASSPKSRAERTGQTTPVSYVENHTIPSRTSQARINKPEREPGDDFHELGEPGYGKDIRLAIPRDKSLPKDVANALADTWHADSAQVLSKMASQAKSAFSWSSWLDPLILDHLKTAEDYFLAAVPKQVCPDCKGQKVVNKKACLTCRQGGYLAGQIV